MSSLLRDFRTWPGAKQWLYCLLTTVALLGLAWLFLPHFADLDNRPSLLQMVKVAAVAFLFPAFFEETVFRGLLNRTQTRLSITLSTALFVIWHPIAGHVFIPSALPYVTDLRFLAFTVVFGVAFCLMRRLTGSMWPPILCHWIVTVTWKALGGAQFLTN